MTKLPILAALLLGIVPAQAQKTIDELKPPTSLITAPSNGATRLSGNVTVTPSCSDAIHVSYMVLWVDNIVYASQSTIASVNWDTTKYANGSHTLYLQCTNVSGVVGPSSTITVSTSNSVAAKTIYVDPTSATDCPPHTGLSSSSPCSSFAGVMSILRSIPLHGGDSILQKAGTTLTLSDLTRSRVLALAGPKCDSTGCFVAQNTYPGKTITISTYGGSGNCHVLSGVTTDCANVVVSPTANVPRNSSPFWLLTFPMWL
jgi:hypothetical protein